jgi:cGMP-dependent protein kinase
MLECSSPWLVNLVATAQDDKNIYMLLEAVMGGELFAYLQVRTNISSVTLCKVHELM